VFHRSSRFRLRRPPHDAPPEAILQLHITAIAVKGTQQQMLDRNARFQWIGTKQLMLIMLALWLLFAMAVHQFVVPLNRIIIPYLDLPLGFFMAAQGALLAFVVMAFVFSSRQERVEHDRFSDGGHS
jgi:putative solute:sodium symporter small subunit